MGPLETVDSSISYKHTGAIRAAQSEDIYKTGKQILKST